MNLIESNPAIKNNPRYKEMIDVIRRNDSVRGEEIARNLCATYGDTPEATVEKAKKFFGI